MKHFIKVPVEVEDVSHWHLEDQSKPWRATLLCGCAYPEEKAEAYGATPEKAVAALQKLYNGRGMSEEKKCPYCGAKPIDYGPSDPRSAEENWACGTFRRGSRVWQSTECELRVAEAENERLQAERNALAEIVRALRSELQLARELL